MASSAQWNTETAYVLTIYKYLLGILGLWVLDEENVFSRIRWFISIMVEMTATISLSLEVIRHCHGYEDAFDAFLSASTSVISILKLLLHRMNWRDKLILVQAIIHDWTYVKNPHSRDIMLKYARTGRLGSSIIFYLGCASCVFLFSLFIFANLDLPWISLEQQNYNKTSERRLLLSTYCVFEIYTSLAYGFVEALQTLQILVNCISQCGNDGFFFDLTMHVCGQFEVFRMDFVEISSRQSLSRNKLGLLLKRHHRLIDLAHHLGRFVFFFQMGSAYIAIAPLIIGSLLSLAMSSSLQNVTTSEDQMQLPQEMACPSNVPIVCYGMYLLQSVQLISTSIGNIGSDVFLFAVCMHLCYIFLSVYQCSSIMNSAKTL